MDAPSMARRVPREIRKRSLGERIRWARQSAGLSHDRLVGAIGRSNRGHLIKIEQGAHVPRRDLRDAIADATGVPRDLFAEDDDEEADRVKIARSVEGLVSVLIAEVRRSVETESAAKAGS